MTAGKPHGYCFDVGPLGGSPNPIKSMGRFSHEAVAVDPRTDIVYETEDGPSWPGDTGSGFYRFIPTYGGSQIGELQMMKIKGQPGVNTRFWVDTSTTWEVEWADVPVPDPPTNASNGLLGPSPFQQGLANGGASFQRLEGCWYGGGSIYFASTSGGAAGRGQVWEFRPEGDDGGLLTLIFESRGEFELDSPDNLAVSPQGALLLCEDGSGSNFLRGVTLDGRIFDFAENVLNDFEFAGATFAEADPAWNDRKIRGDHAPLGNRWERVTLFVNTQGSTSGPNPPSAGNEGLTYAIWGPWKEGAL